MSSNNQKSPSAITRRQFVTRSVAGSLLLGAPAILRGNPLKSPEKRPNIIYFVVHDLGKHCSPYGIPVRTPTLDAMAAGGLVMDNAFCASPPCSPSRGCVMTGHYPHRNGLPGLVNYDWELAAEPENIVDVFNANGYDTVSAGFTHERKGGPPAMGYQRILRNRGGMPDNFIENAVDDALGYLRKRKPGDKPFYMNIGTMETHGSQWEPTSRFAREYGRIERFGVDKREDVYIPPEMPANDFSYEMMRHFQPCVRYMDSQFSRFFEAFRNHPEADNTLLVFTTDHGILSSRGKGTAYDHGMEIASIFYQPSRIKGGQRFPHLFNNLDFFATFLHYAGIAVPYNYGVSHWNGVSGEGSYTPQEAIFTERNYHESWDPVRTVRTRKFHYMRNFHPFAKHYPTPAEIMASDDPRWTQHWPSATTMHGPDHSSKKLADLPDRPREELYDIINDPYEEVNLAADPQYAAVRKELSDKLDANMRLTRDPVPHGPIPPTQAQYRVIKQRTGETVGPPIEEILGVRPEDRV